MEPRIGVDLGGTKIELIALDPSGREVLRTRVPTPQGDYDATVAAVVALIETAEKDLAGKASLGIGTPGTLSKVTGLVKNANSTCLNGRPLKQDLEKALGREVRIANDANCFALSEASMAQARARGGVSASFSAPASGRDRRATARCWSGRTRSRGVGPQPAAAAAQGRPALARLLLRAQRAASKPTCPVRRWRRTGKTLKDMENASPGRWPG
jgi:fructokinase/N-acetylglucosamine kinase